MTVAPPESPNAGPSQEELLDAMLLHTAHSGPPSPVHKTVRSSFIPRSDSPGPAAYNPNEALVKVSPGTTVFGTCTRDKENTRYISALHSAGTPALGNPGPGTYRVMMADKYPHSPKRSYSPTWKFGTGPRDADDRAGERSPGPIYTIPEPRATQAYSFAPMGDPEYGRMRSRDDSSGVYISALHSRADPTTSPDARQGAGPGAYDVSNVNALSPKRTAARTKFGSASRDAQNSLMTLQLAVEPRATSALDNPGAIYNLPSPTDKRTTKFGTGQRSFSPEKGQGAAGPYLSRLHEAAQLGALSPGPGTYAVTASSPKSKVVGGWFGDAPTFSFGTGPQTVTDRSSEGPAPGAYQPRQESLSRSQTAPAYTLGPALRTDFTTVDRDPSVPGPGAYDVAHTCAHDASKRNAAAYTMSGTGKVGRSSFVAPTISPGPAAYSSHDTHEPGPAKGFSFGVREKTLHEKSTISVRFHGPLACLEARGTQSPGPGLYDVRSSTGRLSPVRRSPDMKFGTGNRMGVRTYISKLHSEAAGMGTDSPGPGAYKHESFDPADVTSRYRKAPAATFSCSPRFGVKVMTF